MRHRDGDARGALNALARGGKGLFSLADEGRDRGEEVREGDQDEDEREKVL